MPCVFGLFFLVLLPTAATFEVEVSDDGSISTYKARHNTSNSRKIVRSSGKIDPDIEDLQMIREVDEDDEDESVISEHLKAILSPSTSWGSTEFTTPSDESHVYLIGNGPISEADHSLIAKMRPDRIYRFNGLNSMRPGEKVGNVFVREYGGTGGFWGLGHCAGGENNYFHICSRLAESKRITLIRQKGDKGPGESMVHSCAKMYPHVPLTLASETCYELLYMDHQVTSSASAGFSSGFVGLVRVLKEHPPPNQIHVFGMNWHGGGWHDFKQEGGLIHQMPTPRVIIHATNGAAYHKREVCAT